ncbi:MAG: AAA family ATPase, partial [Candidatus Hodarchaeota archaeon]
MKIHEFELTDFEGVRHLLIKNPPDTVVLIGANGSGKSTVLRALNQALNACFGYSDCPKGIRLV